VSAPAAVKRKFFREFGKVAYVRVVNSEEAAVRVQVLHHFAAGVCRQQRVVFGPVEAKLFASLVVGRHAEYGQILALKRAKQGN